MQLQKIQSFSSLAQKIECPLFSCRVRAGFPSPADDFIDTSLDLNEFLIQKPAATFFAWAEGDSLKNVGIENGDLLIIDRSVARQQGSIVVAAIDGQLTCKILDLKNQCLRAANKHYPPIIITEDEDLLIEGVVTHSIKNHLIK